MEQIQAMEQQQTMEQTPNEWEEFLRTALTQGAATPHGYHFFQQFNNNKWEWFTRWVLGIVPTVPSNSLVLGSSIHKALEALYRFGPEKAEEFLTLYYAWAEKTYQTRYIDQQTYAKDMLYAYINSLYTDPTYRTLSTEQEIHFQLPNRFPMTARIDRVVEDAQGNVYLVEVKTTSWSITAMATQVALEDQVTAYLYGARQAGIPARGVLLEILYRNSRGGVPTATRPSILYRTDLMVEQWARMMSGIVDDLYYRLHLVGDLKTVTVEDALYSFPRNGEASSKFGDIYAPLWVQGYSLNPTLPENFRKDPQALTVVQQFVSAYDRYVLRRPQ